MEVHESAKDMYIILIPFIEKTTNYGSKTVKY